MNSVLFQWRCEILGSDLPPTVRHVLLTLSMHMNSSGGSCFPSYDTVAYETGLHRATVIRAITQAKESGWIAVEHSRGRVSNHYFALTEPSPYATVAEDNGCAEYAEPSPSAQQPSPSAQQPSHSATRGRQEGVIEIVTNSRVAEAFASDAAEVGVAR